MHFYAIVHRQKFNELFCICNDSGKLSNLSPTNRKINKIYIFTENYRFKLIFTFGTIAALNVHNKEKIVKKLIAVFAPLALVLTACVSPSGTTGGTSTAPTAQQLGTAALKIAINAKCSTELNNLAAWQTATKLMTTEQKTNIQGEICGCVSEKAPQSVTAVDLAAAAIDPNARATIVSNAVTKTINACVAEAVN